MGEVDLDSAPGVRPQLHLVLLGGGERGLAALVLGEVVHADDRPARGLGRRRRQVDVQQRLRDVGYKYFLGFKIIFLTFTRSRLEAITFSLSLKYSTG